MILSWRSLRKTDRLTSMRVHLFLFNHKMKKLKKALTVWSRATFGDIFQRLASLEEVLQVHETQFELNLTMQNRERIQRVQTYLIRVWALEEEFWKQKAGMC